MAKYRLWMPLTLLILVLVNESAVAGPGDFLRRCWAVLRGEMGKPNPDLHDYNQATNDGLFQRSSKDASLFMNSHRDLQPAFPILFSRKSIHTYFDAQGRVERRDAQMSNTFRDEGREFIERVKKDLREEGHLEAAEHFDIPMPQTEVQFKGTTDQFLINFSDIVHENGATQKYDLHLELHFLNTGKCNVLFKSGHINELQISGRGLDDRYLVKAIQEDPRFLALRQKYGKRALARTENPSRPELTIELKNSAEVREFLLAADSKFSLR